MDTAISDMSSARCQSEQQLDSVIWLTAIADYCSLISLLLELPTAELVDSFVSNALLEDYQSIVREMNIKEDVKAVCDLFFETQEELKNASDPSRLLRSEHTRLFTHPLNPVIKPFEGVFLDKERLANGKKSAMSLLFVNDGSIDADWMYRRAGCARSSTSSIPSDYIVTEIEFLKMLYTFIAQAILNGNDKGRIEQCELLDEFYSKHVSLWMPQFFQSCMDNSSVAFYRMVGLMGVILMHQRIQMA